MLYFIVKVNDARAPNSMLNTTLTFSMKVIKGLKSNLLHFVLIHFFVVVVV